MTALPDFTKFQILVLDHLSAKVEPVRHVQLIHDLIVAGIAWSGKSFGELRRREIVRVIATEDDGPGRGPYAEITEWGRGRLALWKELHGLPVVPPMAAPVRVEPPALFALPPQGVVVPPPPPPIPNPLGLLVQFSVTLDEVKAMVRATRVRPRRRA